MPDSAVTLRDIYLARRAIAPLVRRTPLVRSAWLEEITGTSVYLKLENVQETGAFKVRGAANKLLSLEPAERARGVVTVSTGNHGRAVSYVAKQLGINASVCISSRVPHNKVEALRHLGAEVVVHGESQDEAGDRALQLQEERGLTLIHPFDDPAVIAGQGTLGVEVLEDLPSVDTILVPLSGGGLISGVALAVKAASRAIRVVGISMERAPAMYHSLMAGVPIAVPEEETLADSLAGGIGLDNRHTFRIVQDYVDEVILVSEEEIAAAMTFALRRHQLVVEGAGAVGIAALLQEKIAALGRRVAVIVSGGNVDISFLVELVRNRP